MSNYKQSHYAPLALVEVCAKSKQKASSVVVKNNDKKFLQTGRRNPDLASVGGFFRSRGVSTNDVEILLQAINSTIAEPLDEYEVSKIGQSVGSYAVTPDAFTHDSFAALYASEYNNELLYCIGRGFYHYQDDRWVLDREELIATHKARLLSEQIKTQIVSMKNDLDSEKYQKLLKAVTKTKNAGFLSQSLSLVKSDPTIHLEFCKFDQDIHLINLKNGTMNLNTGKLQGFNPADYLTYKLDITYDNQAKCPNFEKFLSEILPAEKYSFILRVIAYALTGTGKEQLFFILHGRGKNGKSTLLDIIDFIFGSLLVNIQPQSLNSKLDGQIRNDLAGLAGKNFMVTSETNAGSILDAPLLKQITGHDKITARFLYKEFFSFTPRCVPFIVTNHLPIIDGSDYAMERRICLLSFDTVIAQADLGLIHKLKSESSGIFNLIIIALKEYQKGGLQIPQCVLQRTKAFIERSNLMKGFFSDELEISLDEKDYLTAEHLYRMYVTWAEKNGYKPMTMNPFKEGFEKETGIEQGRKAGYRYWPRLRRKQISYVGLPEL